ncbi:3-deoxy-D-manno-octulosonic acid transferase [Bizionia argentinensis JUB59]|uniref:3-deoxy-D-manno-octulosonic acid transferase n=1 Tax=Bizionia argentinensis JUB59 TaxID=1046627 RepID=G2EDN5_9FLAO|nr:glycosyltransferase N-terminal domain-containing protein [Bizionia argentinensis]EGV43548.2 3-deoxy-D-manno-octulosonic acid transferase [Bizionia argentinensis JUB59]
MRIIFNIGIYLAQLILPIVALFNPKIKLGVTGRSQTFSILENTLDTSKKTLWYHCASLGEYEQGLPVFKELRALYREHQIVLTFFSPSGYEIRKNTDIADIVVYLPLDSPSNAKNFLNLVKPELTIFVKYDIWPNYLLELKRRNHRALLISALFRKDQSYFKFFGGFMRQAVFAFEHIFTQNENTKQLLATINYNQTTVTGDTRFDRVYSQLAQNNELDFIGDFKNNKICVVAGSTWPEDEALLIDFINNTESDTKFIIAPHNIKVNQIQKLKGSLNKKTILFSEKEHKNYAEYSVFIIDTIGLLTKIYNYADIAYVGGAMGSTGLHNTLEPAVFGVPIIVGKHYDKFPEASHMILEGGMFTISNKNELESTLNLLIKNPEKSQNIGSQNFKFIKNSMGAVIQIVNYIRI